MSKVKNMNQLQHKDKWNIVIGMAATIGDMIQNGMVNEAKPGLVLLVAFAADMSNQDLPLSLGNVQRAKEQAIEWMIKYGAADYNIPVFQNPDKGDK